MLQNFWFNVEYGINHVLDINAYDHVLFLIVLTVPYVFKDWKRILFTSIYVYFRAYLVLSFGSL